MPKKVAPLADAQVRRITSPGLHAVGGVAGLCLQVQPGGAARSWILRVRIAGKRRNFGLGGYPDVTLSQARERARGYMGAIAEGRDPAAERQAQLDAVRAAEARRITFADAARERHKVRVAEFRNVKHRADWLSSLERYAFPILGGMQVADIEPAHVLQVLNPIWAGRTETATRVRQRIEDVLRWAIASGYRAEPNPARWEYGLKPLLPKPSKLRQKRHYSALPWQQVPEFVQALRKREGMAARALEFAILTAARSGEVRAMTWDEVDLKACTWTIPGERMKAGKPHTAPLSGDAVAILQALPRMDGNSLVFPAPRGGVLSDMSISAVCRRMGVEAVPHGFRSSFKDWARNATMGGTEKTDPDDPVANAPRYADEASELALAHVSTDATRAAYARDELLGPRARMMADWAQFITTGKLSAYGEPEGAGGDMPTGAKIIPIRGCR